MHEPKSPNPVEKLIEIMEETKPYVTRKSGETQATLKLVLAIAEYILWENGRKYRDYL